MTASIIFVERSHGISVGAVRDRSGASANGGSVAVAGEAAVSVDLRSRQGQLSVLSLQDDREVVVVDRAGQVVFADPALGDREAWAEICTQLAI